MRLVTIDTMGDEAALAELVRFLKAACGSWARLTDSTWLVDSPDEPKKIRDSLTAFAGGKTVYVSVFTLGNSYAYSLPKATSTWFKKRSQDDDLYN